MKDKFGICDTNIKDDPGLNRDMEDVMDYLVAEASKASIIIELGCQYGNGSTKAFSWGLRQSPVAEKDKLMISVDMYNQMTYYRIPKDPWWHFIEGASIDVTVTNVTRKDRDETKIALFLGQVKLYLDSAVTDGNKVKHLKTLLADFEAPVVEERLFPGVASQIATLLNGRKADIIFFDSDQTPETVTQELNAYKAFCHDTTKLLFHDTAMTSMFPGYRQAIIDWGTANGYAYEDVFPYGQGLGKLTKAIK